MLGKLGKPILPKYTSEYINENKKKQFWGTLSRFWFLDMVFKDWLAKDEDYLLNGSKVHGPHRLFFKVQYFGLVRDERLLKIALEFPRTILFLRQGCFFLFTIQLFSLTIIFLYT